MRCYLLALIVTWTYLLSTTSHIQAEGINEVQANSQLGPVTTSLFNMANKTAEASDALALQLKARVEYLSALLHGSLEVLTAAAIHKLADPLMQANATLLSPNCSQTWNMDELHERIADKLENCTHSIVELKAAFEMEIAPILDTIQSTSQMISTLPEICYYSDIPGQAVESFSTSTSCFVTELGNINQLVTAQLSLANIVVLRTRKRNASTVNGAVQCVDNVVDDTIEFLEMSLEDC